jgi:hypothetical protein
MQNPGRDVFKGFIFLLSSYSPFPPAFPVVFGLTQTTLGILASELLLFDKNIINEEYYV